MGGKAVKPLQLSERNLKKRASCHYGKMPEYETNMVLHDFLVVYETYNSLSYKCFANSFPCIRVMQETYTFIYDKEQMLLEGCVHLIIENHLFGALLITRCYRLYHCRG